MTPPDPGGVLRRALVAWGFGHLALGEVRTGRTLLIAELAAALLVAWLTIGLADSTAYLVPFVAGVAFIVVWAWQAVDAYRRAQARQPARAPAPMRSPAAAIGWLSLPLLLWGTGFWLIGAGAATPAAVLDRFVTRWSADDLDAAWPDRVRTEAREAAQALGTTPDRFRDLRVRIVSDDGSRAEAVAESIHFERRESRLFGFFPGSELVPVPDAEVLTLFLAARPVEVPGGGLIGAATWELVDAEAR